MKKRSIEAIIEQDDSVECPDSIHFCPDKYTCCPSSNNSFGCCPSANVNILSLIKV